MAGALYPEGLHSARAALIDGETMRKVDDLVLCSMYHQHRGRDLGHFVYTEMEKNNCLLFMTKISLDRMRMKIKGRGHFVCIATEKKKKKQKKNINCLLSWNKDDIEGLVWTGHWHFYTQSSKCLVSPLISWYCDAKMPACKNKTVQSWKLTKENWYSINGRNKMWWN